MTNRLHTEPSSVTAEEGEVMMDGPDGVSVSLHPDAAEETARRLLAAAAEARGQRSDRPGGEGSGPADH